MVTHAIQSVGNEQEFAFINIKRIHVDKTSEIAIKVCNKENTFSYLNSCKYCKMTLSKHAYTWFHSSSRN